MLVTYESRDCFVHLVSPELALSLVSKALRVDSRHPLQPSWQPDSALGSCGSDSCWQWRMVWSLVPNLIPGTMTLDSISVHSGVKGADTGVSQEGPQSGHMVPVTADAEWA